MYSQTPLGHSYYYPLTVPVLRSRVLVYPSICTLIILLLFQNRDVKNLQTRIGRLEETNERLTDLLKEHKKTIKVLSEQVRSFFHKEFTANLSSLDKWFSLMILKLLELFVKTNFHAISFRYFKIVASRIIISESAFCIIIFVFKITIMNKTYNINLFYRKRSPATTDQWSRSMRPDLTRMTWKPLTCSSLIASGSTRDSTTPRLGCSHAP